MSTDVGADTADAPDVSTADYDEMLQTLDIGIDEARRKIKEGRIRDVDREKARVKQWRALGYLIDIRRKVANDRDLEKLAEQVEDLKEMHGDST